MIIVTKKRRKILWQIFPSFLIITVISLTAVTWYSTTVFKSFFLDNTERDLTTRAEFVKREFLSRYPDSDFTQSDIDIICKDIGRTTGTRVTIILPSGQVVGDSLGNISSMENHKHRYEIALAMKEKKGIAIRKSGTLGESMMYIALPVLKSDTLHKDNNNRNDLNINELLWIVRVAISIESIENQIKSIQKNIFIALLITAAAAAGVSLFVTRRITKPIEAMRTGADNFANNKLDTLLPLPDSEELFQLALTMNKMAQALDEKIKTLEERGMELEAVHSSMREGIIAVDPDERIITVNSAAAQMFGYSPEMVKGRSIHEIARHYELQQLIRKALAKPEPVEDDIVISGSEECIYNVHSTALCDSSGARLGTLIIFHDITRIRKLETMHKDFAANVSHELKTPLTSIKGFAETLENIMQDLGTDEASLPKHEKAIKHDKAIQFIKIIDKNVDRLIALINDLLALSRVEREEGTVVRLERHDIAQTIQEAIDDCRAAAALKNIEIKYVAGLSGQNADQSNTYISDADKKDGSAQISSKDGSKEGLTALIDPILMQQAVVNLLDNAIKYSAQGGQVVAACNSESSSIIISITDYGQGIAKEHISRIFQRFYRVDKSRSRDMGGTGLGLAIVKHIVRYHKGDISVISEPGKGSTFKIILPSVG